jgi:mannose-1-phosphate guanylyltransferase/mannose-6-phosphate isomerase
MKIVPVILSGGSGMRLWPLSRKQYPKQYLSLVGDHTMLQETILRLKGLDDISDPVIICNSDHRFLVEEQCQSVNISNPTILLEGVGRNTALAIAASAVYLLKQSDNVLLLVLSADHIIQDVNSFYLAIDTATRQAKDGKLVTFGIVPTSANTSYGYIKLSENNFNDWHQVEQFIEKPNLEVAETYLEQGGYLWNSGMFMFKADILINELNTYSSDTIKKAKSAVDNAKKDLNFIYLGQQEFESSPSISIDHALMEKSNNVVVVPLDAKWSDIGSWKALYDISVKDKNGNVITGDVIAKDTVDTYINSNNCLIITIGVENLIIVDTVDAIFIADQDRAQEVKQIVGLMQAENREESGMNRKVYRPWGWYDCIELGKYFQVKKLHIKSGAKLSLQMHHKRAEHWIVVEGVATVINGDEIFNLDQGESTYIPLGVKHALENRSNDLLEVIEVQSGTYLGEDDIVRFKDIYGRIKN